MIKHIGKILANRAKTQFIDFIIDILISSLQEFRRKSQSGEFDVQMNDDNFNAPKPQGKEQITNFFNKQ